MKTMKLFSMAAAALLMAACSNSDDFDVQKPAETAGVYHFEATIAAPNADASMRTVYTEVTESTDPDYKKIKVAWKKNDEIAAIVMNSEDKLVKTVLTVSEVNADGSATISGDITKPNDDVLTVDLIYPADIVTVDANGIGYTISFEKMRDGSTLNGTLKSIADNIDYRMADDCALTVSGDKATLTSAANLESKLSIWKLTLQDDAATPNLLSASQVAIVVGTDVMASATLATAASEVYLPVPAVSEADICIAATTSGGNYIYMKEDVTLAAKKYYQSTVQMTKGAHLALLTANYEAKDGETLTGTLASDVKISIAAPVAPATTTTVTLKDVTINGTNNSSYDWAGINCAGNATINLEGTNTVKGFYEYNPGIYVPSGKTLTIQGTGSLDASSNGSGAGIGGGYDIACGNIAINGGTITATGGEYGAGIGGGYSGTCGAITITSGTITATGGKCAAGIGGGGVTASCGNIRIEGGTITATGGSGESSDGGGAGIGGGYYGSCGTITITSDVTKVEATKGDYAPNSIGAGADGTCGTVSIGGVEGAITTSPYEYSAPPALTLTNPAVGEVIGSDGKNYAADATLPTGVTKVAMIAYVSGSNGLAIALADESDNINWATAKSTCEAKTPAFTGGTWKLPSLDEWKNMLTYDEPFYKVNNLQTALSTAGGDNLQEWMYYWSSTDYDSDNTQACYVKFQMGEADFSNVSKTYTSGTLVRAVLAF